MADDILTWKDSVPRHVRYTCGWSIARTPDGRWQWSAYGVNGMTVGTADTQEIAEQKAKAAEQFLRES